MKAEAITAPRPLPSHSTCGRQAAILDLRWALLIALTSAFSLQPSALLLAAAPLGTAFTYQGRLNDAGAPANGRYDLKFTVFDALAGGIQVGPAVSTNGLAVGSGLFTVTLDFGGVFTNTARWLQIEVKTNGAVSYATLVPRQPLVPVPQALYAPNAGTATAAGTATTAQGVAAGSVNLAGLNTASVDTRYVRKTGDSMSGPLAVPADGLQAGGNQLVLAGGNVGIGTPTPAAKLDVAGNGRMGGLELASVWGAVAMNATWDNGSSNWRRLSDGYASLFQQGGPAGGLNWGLADTGPAGENVGFRTAFQLTKDGDVVVDASGANTNGTLTGGLRFGWSGSGEGIASKRSDGGNQWGLDLFAGGWPRLSLANNGNVGIGEANPMDLLVLGQGGNLVLKAPAAIPDDPGDIIFRTATGLQKARIYATPELGQSKLHLSGGDSNARHLTVDADGNVGIGTSAPATKLEVQGGAIKATGGFILELRTNDPPNPVPGQMWLRTDL